jgi:predicted MFS family arabinose efflux permease
MMADIHGERRSQALTEQAILAYSFAVLGPIVTGFCVAQGFGWRPVVIAGSVAGVALIFLFRSSDIPQSASPAAPRGTGAPLPAAFWAYWALLAFSIACEFTVLLWAPAFLERVVGFAPAVAATGAAGFFLGVLIGRLFVRVIVRRVDPRLILIVGFAIGFVGFVAYWVIGTPAFALIGVFMLGLCIAPQYPLTVALALGATRGATDVAATRLALAFGLAILIAPAALGALADRVGLSLAHLTVLALLAAGLGSFLVAGVLEKRARA